MVKVKRQAQALTEMAPWLVAINPALRENVHVPVYTASGSSNKGDKIAYVKEPTNCRHTSSRYHPAAARVAPAVVKEYKHKGITYQECSLCGSRWMLTKCWQVPLDPYPRPGTAPRRTAQKSIGDHVMGIGMYKDKKVKDLPEHYLKWAKEQEAKKEGMHQELSYVVAYAMVTGAGASASSAPQPRCSPSSSDSSDSPAPPPSKASSTRTKRKTKEFHIAADPETAEAVDVDEAMLTEESIVLEGLTDEDL